MMRRPPFAHRSSSPMIAVDESIDVIDDVPQLLERLRLGDR